MDDSDPASSSLNVLVVDDNQDAALTLMWILRIWGYHVRVAFDGKKAVQSATESPPDCIFLDINMPGMDGFQVAHAIRHLPATQKTKLVAFTAYTDERHIKRIRESGFDDYLSKLADMSSIQDVLKKYQAAAAVPTRT